MFKSYFVPLNPFYVNQSNVPVSQFQFMGIVYLLLVAQQAQMTMLGYCHHFVSVIVIYINIFYLSYYIKWKQFALRDLIRI